ncbi:MAG: hypothetical protein JWP03_2474 [Phycisphaerales bacterium]|nr:hypothetical protein [Phycisphaerales bacterium]
MNKMVYCRFCQKKVRQKQLSRHVALHRAKDKNKHTHARKANRAQLVVRRKRQTLPKRNNDKNLSKWIRKVVEPWPSNSDNLEALNIKGEGWHHGGA